MRIRMRGHFRLRGHFHMRGRCACLMKLRAGGRNINGAYGRGGVEN